MKKRKNSDKYTLAMDRKETFDINNVDYTIEYTAFWDVTVFNNEVDNIELDALKFDDEKQLALPNAFNVVYHYEVANEESVYDKIKELDDERREIN